MKIAFDLDCTIGAHPAVLIALARTLIRGGAEVFVLTAAAGELQPADRPAEVVRRLEQLGGKGLRVVFIESRDKPKFCVAHEVDLLIDDTPFDLAHTETVQLLPGSALRAAASALLLG